MADQKLTELPVLDPTQDSDQLYIVRSGVSYQTTIQAVHGSIVAVAWGDITGTLGNQTDLQAELDGKVDAGTITGGSLTMNEARLLGRGAGTGVGAVAEITVGAGLNLSAGGALTATAAAPAWGEITGTLSNQTDLNTALGLKAPLASPALTGTPTAPTAAPGTNTTQIATTAFDAASIVAERTATATLTGKTISGASNTLSALPAAGISGVIPIANLATGTPTGAKFIRDDGTLQVPPDAAAVWGGITGTLSSQSDLNTALGLKAPLASPTFTGTPAAPTAAGGTNSTQLATTAFVTNAAAAIGRVIQVACSDVTTNITAGTAKVTFRAPYGLTLTGVNASVSTAPTGSTIIIDVNKNGTTVLSTKVSIDASELTSVTAATPPVISVSAFNYDDEITIDFDQVGSTIPGKQVMVELYYTVP